MVITKEESRSEERKLAQFTFFMCTLESFIVRIYTYITCIISGDYKSKSNANNIWIFPGFYSIAISTNKKLSLIVRGVVDTQLGTTYVLFVKPTQ